MERKPEEAEGDRNMLNRRKKKEARTPIFKELTDK